MSRCDGDAATNEPTLSSSSRAQRGAPHKLGWLNTVVAVDEYSTRIVEIHHGRNGNSSRACGKSIIAVEGKCSWLSPPRRSRRSGSGSSGSGIHQEALCFVWTVSRSVPPMTWHSLGGTNSLLCTARSAPALHVCTVRTCTVPKPQPLFVGGVGVRAHVSKIE